MLNEIQQKISNCIDELNLRDASFVVAVSGGSDSLCLLHAMHSLGLNIKAAHLNHMIRGKEAENDAVFVEEFCKTNNIPYIIENLDVPAFQKANNISSVEEAARIVRYGFLHNVAKGSIVITGHNQDDNVETILMHILRGCGPSGLIGLNQLSDISTQYGPIKVLRPLLTVSKNDTLEYCKEADIVPCFDSTNDSLEYTRNRIRKELIPLLETFNPDIQSAILRLSSLTKEENEFANDNLNNLPFLLDILEGSVVITRRDFNALKPYAQKVLLRLAIKTLLGSTQDIENKHIDDMLKLASGPSGKRISLPNNLVFTVEYLRLTLAFSGFETEMQEFDVDLEVPGETIIPNGTIKAEIINENVCVIENNPKYAYFDYDLLDNLSVRTRREGDSFIPFGADASKKVARFLMDAHVSQNERDDISIVLNNEDIIWVTGIRASNLYKVTDLTNHILKLTFNEY